MITEFDSWKYNGSINYLSLLTVVTREGTRIDVKKQIRILYYMEPYMDKQPLLVTKYRPPSTYKVVLKHIQKEYLYINNLK